MSTKEASDEKPRGMHARQIRCGSPPVELTKNDGQSTTDTLHQQYLLNTTFDPSGEIETAGYPVCNCSSIVRLVPAAKSLTIMLCLPRPSSVYAIHRPLCDT